MVVVKVPVPIVQLRDAIAPVEASVNLVLWLTQEGPEVKSAVGEAAIATDFVKETAQLLSEVAVSTTL